MEFSEDSPAFRRKVDALDRNVEGEKLTRTFPLAKCSDGNDWTEAVEIALEVGVLEVGGGEIFLSERKFTESLQL